jgi:transcriptional regulator GlxA family with amidase domain
MLVSIPVLFHAFLQLRAMKSLTFYPSIGESKKGISDTRIQKILAYITSHIEQPITLEELAKLIHLSKDHLIHLFKKEIGCKPIRYINQKKI